MQAMSRAAAGVAIGCALLLLSGIAGRSADQARPVLTPLWPNAVAGKWLDVAPADLDGDGNDELLALAQGGKVEVLTADGKRLSRHRIAPQMELLQVGNLDGNPGPEIVAWENWGERIYAYNTKWAQLWTFGPNTSGIDWVHMANITGDGADELIVGYNGGGGLHLVNGAGKRIWRATGDRGNCWNVGAIRTGKAPVVLSLDADGEIHFHDSTGKELPGIPGEKTRNYFRILGTADLDGNGVDEIAAVGTNLGGKAERLCLFTANRELLWQHQVTDSMQSWRHKHLAFPRVDAAHRTIVMAADEGAVWLFDSKGNTGQPWQAPREVTSLCALRRKSGPDLLVVATDRELQAYELAPPVAPEGAK